VKTREGNKFAAFNGLLSTANPALYSRIKDFDFLSKIAETFVTRILIICLGLITSVIVARVLGPEGRGLYALAVIITAMGIQFGNLGLHASNTYYVAKDHDLLPPLLANTLVVSFLLGGLGSGLAWIVFLLWPKLAPINGSLLALSLAWIPFGLAYLLLQNLLLGIHQVRAYNKIQLISNILGVVVIGLIIVVGLVSVETLFCAGFVAALISFCWALARIRSHLSRVPHPSFSVFQENIRYGIKAYLAALFAFLVVRVDLLMVKYMLNAEQAGYYSVAVSLGDMLYILPTVVGSLLFPKLSELTSDTEKWRLAKQTTLVLGAVMLPVTAVVIFVAKPIVRIMFGNPFLPAVSSFIVLSVGMLFYGVNNMVSNYLASIGFPWFSVHVWIIATGLNIALTLFLISNCGIIGAAISSLICYATVFFLQLIYAGRYLE